MLDMSSTEGAENAIKVEFSIEGLAAIPMMITGHWSLMYFKKNINKIFKYTWGGSFPPPVLEKISESNPE